MRLTSFLLVLLMMSLLWSACGSSSSTDEDRRGATPPDLPNASGEQGSGVVKVVGDHFVLAPEISIQQQEALARDLMIVRVFNPSLGPEEDRELAQLLGISRVDSYNMDAWLRERIRFLIGQELSRYNFAMVYPEQRRYGYFRFRDENAIATELTGAVNVGAGLYSFTRKLAETELRPQYLRMQIADQWVDIHSPRVGIMQIGPALFGVQVNTQDEDAFANSALRIETLFHEARHSDGNTSSGSLGFVHVNCPAGTPVPPELIDKPACDASSNGAYMVGALVIRSYYQKCGRRCSLLDREVLRAYYLDSLSRVIIPEDGWALPRLDPQPESGLETADISGFQLIPLR